MVDVFPKDAPRGALADEWAPEHPIPLGGVLERNQFAPLLTVFVGLLVAFILFQIIISPLVTLALLMAQGVSPGEMVQALERVIEEHAAALLTANSIGQVFGLAVPAWLFARLHTARPAAFLRLRSPDPTLLVFSVIGLVGLTPLVQWTGQVNEQLPLPEFIRQFEQSQIELIEKVLMTDTGLFFNLLVLAVVPALCEELLFRGYAQRQAERALGAAGGLVLAGVVFGLYHLRLSQVVPLSILGIYLGYITWRTGSLWPAVAVHFLNNAFAVAVGAYVARQPDVEPGDLDSVQFPWYFLLAGLLVFVLVVRAMEQQAGRLLSGPTAPGSPPVP